MSHALASLPVIPMQSRNSTHGTCPTCGETLQSHDILITYDTDDGTSHFADCPACRRVVHPTEGE